MIKSGFSRGDFSNKDIKFSNDYGESPLEAGFPFFIIYDLVHIAEVLEVDDKFLTMGFSLSPFKILTPDEQARL